MFEKEKYFNGAAEKCLVTITIDYYDATRNTQMVHNLYKLLKNTFL